MTNTKGIRKAGLGLGAAVMAAALVTPVGREAATNLEMGVRNTALDAMAEFRYGEAGVLPYNTTKIMLGNAQTPETLALHYGNSEYVRGVHDLVARYIMVANNLPDTNARIEAGQKIVIPFYDPQNGRRLGDLVDEALSHSSK